MEPDVGYNMILDVGEFGAEYKLYVGSIRSLIKIFEDGNPLKIHAIIPVYPQKEHRNIEFYLSQFKIPNQVNPLPP